MSYDIFFDACRDYNSFFVALQKSGEGSFQRGLPDWKLIAESPRRIELLRELLFNGSFFMCTAPDSPEDTRLTEVGIQMIRMGWLYALTIRPIRVGVMINFHHLIFIGLL